MLSLARCDRSCVGCC